MIAQTVQIVTERGVQTSVSGDPAWLWAVAIAILGGWLWFVISYTYWRPHNTKEGL